MSTPRSAARRAVRARPSTLAVPLVLVTAALATLTPAAHGQAEVGLIPAIPGPYEGGEVVRITAWLTNHAAFRLPLISVRLNFTQSDAEIGLPATLDWTLTPATENTSLPIPTWESSAPTEIVPAGGSLQLAVFTITVPTDPGCYTLDVLSAAAGANVGQITFLGPTGAPVTWTADSNDPSAALLGGRLALAVDTDGLMELCNGVDDDCDGEIDEGFEWPVWDFETQEIQYVGPGNVCWLNVGNCVVQGRLQCSSDGLSLECVLNEPPPPPGVEGPYGDASCFNFRDDDCDGLIDYEDPDCQGAELCDGFDNDGDGQIDEPWPLLGQPCTVGSGTCEKTGVWICAPDGSGIVCSAAPFPPGPEGPPGGIRCGDGLDNDCDGLVDLDDPDCQEPERCDGLDNDGDGQTDEDFPQLGSPCVVGVGACERVGVYICAADGGGVICSAAPGAPGPEGPAGCACIDGIDNDCDGLVDLDDPDCGSGQLTVTCALPYVCGDPNEDCYTGHVVQFAAVGGGPNPLLEARLFALDDDFATAPSIPVENGDLVRLRSSQSQQSVQTIEVDLNAAFFTGVFEPCMTGPDNGPLTGKCIHADFDCDHDVDLADTAALQLQFGQSLRYHECVAPRPTLRVHGNDGLTDTYGYASNVPYVQVIEPQKTVVSMSEDNTVRLTVAIPNVDPASLQLRIDGFDVFGLLGLNPAIDFPGGPFGGTFPLASSCPRQAEVCQLFVDSAPPGEMSSNTLTMYVRNLCCGGRMFVVEGDPRPGTYPPAGGGSGDCHFDPLLGRGVSHHFLVEIFIPTEDSQLPLPPVTVRGRVCHGRPLPLPTPSGAFVRLNGGLYPLTGPVITPGDGVNTADTYTYGLSAMVPAVDLDESVNQGFPQPGRVARGPACLVAEAWDEARNTTYDLVCFATGPIYSDNKLRLEEPVPHGLSVALDADGLQSLIESILRQTVPGLLEQEILQWYNEYNGKTFTIDFGGPCDPKVYIYPQFDTFSFDPNAFQYVVQPSNGQVDVTAVAPPASADVEVRGTCKVTFLGICIFYVRVDVTVGVSIDEAAVTFTITENDLLTNGQAVVDLELDPNEITIQIAVDNIDFDCVAAPLFDLIDKIFDLKSILQDVAQYYIDNELDISTWLNKLEVPPIPLNFPALQPLALGPLNIDLLVDLTEVEITNQGLAAGFETTFTPLVVDETIRQLPGAVRTETPLPQPLIAGADHASLLVADDAIDQFLVALNRVGVLRTDYQDEGLLGDFLPADCGTLDPESEGFCAALKGTPCGTFPPASPEFAGCLAGQALVDNYNLSANTPVIGYAQLNVPPRLLVQQALSPTQLAVVVHAGQVQVGLVADRNADGQAPQPYATVPSCATPAALGTTFDCNYRQACVDVNFLATLTLQAGPAVTINVNQIVVTNGFGCGGGTLSASELAIANTLANGPVLAQLQAQLNANVNPIQLDGLDFGGYVILNDLELLRVENGDDPVWDDYFGITADPDVNLNP